MQPILGKVEGLVYGAFRIVTGALLACHGLQKIFGLLGGHAQTHDPKMLAAGLIELVGGGLVALGLGASIAAFVASGEMAAAYFMVHAPRGPWPIQNGGELAVAYCFAFLYIAARGSGSLSLDRALGRKG